MYKFETPGHVELRVENKLGDVRLSTHEVPVTEVEIIASGGQGGADDQGAVVEHRELAHGHEVLVQVPAQPGVAEVVTAPARASNGQCPSARWVVRRSVHGGR